MIQCDVFVLTDNITLILNNTTNNYKIQAFINFKYNIAFKKFNWTECNKSPGLNNKIRYLESKFSFC